MGYFEFFESIFGVIQLSILYKTISDCVLQLLFHFSGLELSYILPSDYSHKFEELFHEIESKREELGVSSYGASVTTLEEVFIKVGEEHETETNNTHKKLFRQLSEKQKIPNAGGADIFIFLEKIDFPEILVADGIARFLKLSSHFFLCSWYDNKTCFKEFFIMCLGISKIMSLSIKLSVTII